MTGSLQARPEVAEVRDAITAPWTAASPASVTPSISRWVNLTALAVVLGAVRLILTATLPLDRAFGLFDDDAFYYFGIARHIAHGDGSTFNGIDATNGYHPLWLLLLVPVFAVSDGRTALVVVVIMSMCLFVAAARLLDRLGSLLEARLGMTVFAAPLLVVGSTGPAFWFSGMETGLLITSLLLLALVLYRWTSAASPLTAGYGVGLGGLMALCVMSRLDALFPVAVIAVVMLWGLRRHDRGAVVRLTAAAALLPGVVIAAYLGVNRVLFGTFLPVSGQAKGLGSETNFGALTQFVQAPILFGHNCWLGAIALVAVAFGLRARGAARPLAVFAACVLAGGVLTACYYAVSSSWHLWPWYFYAAPLSLACAGPAIATQVRPLRSTRVAGAVAVITVLCAATIVGGKVVVLVHGGGEDDFEVKARSVAHLVDAAAPPGTAVAMGDRAGNFGYQLEHPLIHLEGLVNSKDYLESLTQRSVGAFLAERNVSVYVRADRELGTPIAVGTAQRCRAFLEPNQGQGPKATVVVCDSDLLTSVPLEDASYRIWRFRPELNP